MSPDEEERRWMLRAATASGMLRAAVGAVRASDFPAAASMTRPRPNALSLRPATVEDAPFLRGLYAETRVREMAATGWPEAMRTAFLQGQYEARERSYRQQYPAATPDVVLAGREPVGTLHLAWSPKAVQVVNVALLAACQGRGWGASLLRQVCVEADRRGVPVRLHVAEDNRAQRLYRRLGFRETGRAGFYLQMERPMPGQSGRKADPTHPAGDRRG